MHMFGFFEIPAVASILHPTVKSLMQRPAHPSKLGEGSSRNGQELITKMVQNKLINCTIKYCYFLFTQKHLWSPQSELFPEKEASTCIDFPYCTFR